MINQCCNLTSFLRVGIFKLFVSFVLVSFILKLEVSLIWTKSNPIFGIDLSILIIFNK